MPPHHTPHLTLVSTHRATIVPDEWAAEHAQVEEYEPRVYTGDEVMFAFFCGGALGCFATVGLAFVWSFWL